MNTLRIVLRNYSDFERALQEEAHLFESHHPGTKIELLSLGIHELYKSAITDGGPPRWPLRSRPSRHRLARRGSQRRRP